MLESNPISLFSALVKLFNVLIRLLIKKIKNKFIFYLMFLLRIKNHDIFFCYFLLTMGLFLRLIVFSLEFL